MLCPIWGRREDSDKQTHSRGVVVPLNKGCTSSLKITYKVPSHWPRFLQMPKHPHPPHGGPAWEPQASWLLIKFWLVHSPRTASAQHQQASLPWCRGSLPFPTASSAAGLLGLSTSSLDHHRGWFACLLAPPYPTSSPSFTLAVLGIFLEHISDVFPFSSTIGKLLLFLQNPV